MTTYDRANSRLEQSTGIEGKQGPDRLIIGSRQPGKACLECDAERTETVGSKLQKVRGAGLAA